MDMRIRQRLHPEDGAAAVEFALIVGVLAMLIFGMLQFGLTFFELQNLRASAREGARLGAVGATPDEIRTRVENASNGAIQSGQAAYPFVKVAYSNTGTFSGGESNLTGNTTAACASTSTNTTDAAVQVRLDIASAPPNLRGLFRINIPLLPTITMNPQIDAQFRCEGAQT
jgi:Flp pilus assembly protein TadG